MGKAARIKRERKAGTRKPNQRATESDFSFLEATRVSAGEVEYTSPVGMINRNSGNISTLNGKSSDPIHKVQGGSIVFRKEASKNHLKRLTGVASALMRRFPELAKSAEPVEDEVVE